MPLFSGGIFGGNGGGTSGSTTTTTTTEPSKSPFSPPDSNARESSRRAPSPGISPPRRSRLLRPKRSNPYELKRSELVPALRYLRRPTVKPLRL
jgi:hypothetical protein